MIDPTLSLICGITLVGVTTFDLFYTTMSFNGAGYINRVTAIVISPLYLFLNRHSSSRNILGFSGMSHVLLSIFLWVFLVWVGLFLILLSDSGSVLFASSGEPAGLVDIFYFSGYTLSTLGNGNFMPSTRWQIVVAVFSFSGFIFITTAMSYLLNLFSAVLQKRSLSLYISNLGQTPQEIVANVYDGGSFSELTGRVSNLQEKINRHNQNYFAYPIAHFFYSTTKAESLALNLTILDEALTIIKFHVEKGPSVEKDLYPLYDSIEKYLETIKRSSLFSQAGHVEVLPDLEKLNHSGVPVTGKPAESMESSYAQKRRKRLSSYLKSCGWNWSDIYIEH